MEEFKLQVFDFVLFPCLVFSSIKFVWHLVDSNAKEKHTLGWLLTTIVFFAWELVVGQAFANLHGH